MLLAEMAKIINKDIVRNYNAEQNMAWGNISIFKT